MAKSDKKKQANRLYVDETGTATKDEALAVGVRYEALADDEKTVKATTQIPDLRKIDPKGLLLLALFGAKTWIGNLYNMDLEQTEIQARIDTVIAGEWPERQVFGGPRYDAEALANAIARAKKQTDIAPFAKIATVSFVEVSPSTVIALNVRATALRSACESRAGEIAASVARNASIVAIFGWIIPAPLQQPRIRTTLPPIRQFAPAHLGRVLGGMIARVNFAKASAVALRARTRSGTALRIFSTRSGTPITPVEHTRICEG